MSARRRAWGAILAGLVYLSSTLGLVDWVDPRVTSGLGVLIGTLMVATAAFDHGLQLPAPPRPPEPPPARRVSLSQSLPHEPVDSG